MLVITIITSTVCFAGVSAKNPDFRFGMRQARGTVSDTIAAGRQGDQFIPMNLQHILYYLRACLIGSNALQIRIFILL
jgi:hypothetical protein